MTREVRELIVKGAKDIEIRDAAIAQGLVTLRGAALNKLKEGRTTVDEVFSVTTAT